ncbi:thymocyte nuclear protein 1-like [Convolutriloba macropyga]|uniref:thymocyte nuclear protein 1-like n=1 Tax=Convolutriloba macropyga TaxID=536237 RepID=UPI003F526531
MVRPKRTVVKANEVNTRSKSAVSPAGVSKRKPATARKLTSNDTSNSAVVQKPTATSKKPIFDHWLMKSEPDSRYEKGVEMKFSIDDLIKEPKSTAHWDGVRNYEARNLLRDQMKLNQQAFFYHSNCKQPGIVGVMKIVKEGYPDHTQFNKSDPHYDASSLLDKPKWYMVDVKYVRKTKRLISLEELKKLHTEHKKSLPKGVLHDLSLFTRSRLSVQPLTKEQFDFILKLEHQDK